MGVFQPPTDANLQVSDVTTNNVSTSKHGFVPKATNAGNFLKDDGTWAAIPGGGDALTTNPLSQFASTTSLQLKGVLSDETGSGAAVFANSPALVTPTGIVKGDVGLGNVDNTADSAKSVASAAILTTARTIDGVSFNGSANVTVIAPATDAATSKATPVDADELPLVDSAASNVLKKLTWANIKATLKTYFDTLYQSLNSNLTTISGLTATTDNFMVAVSSAWASRTPAQVRTTLALVIGTNVQAWSAALDTWAGKTAPSGTVVGTSDSQTLTNKTLDITANALTNVGAAASEVGWEFLGRSAALGASGDTLSLTSFTARKYLKVIVFCAPTGGTINANIRFNNDSGNNYSVRRSENNGADATAVSQSAILATGTAAQDLLLDFDLINNSANEKLVSFQGNLGGGAGAANAPNRSDGQGKWANTAAQVSRIDIVNSGTGDFTTASEFIVFGHD